MQQAKTLAWRSLPSVKSTLRLPRFRLLGRWTKFAIRSVKAGYWDFVGHFARALFRLVGVAIVNAVPGKARVKCVVCGWQGRRFYPNVGAGYDDVNTMCPSCLCERRHRSMVVLLHHHTQIFAPDTRVVEVAPVRMFERCCLQTKGNRNYTSFDLERYAMERGDITDMRYPKDSADYFVCFHVLEHIPEVDKAIDEIYRVLDVGGTAILQVPIDWNLARTVEYDEPDMRYAGHVRQYGTDFPQLVATRGFDVTAVRVEDVASEDQIERYGLCREPVYLATKQG